MNLLDLMVKIGIDDQTSGKLENISSGITKKLGTAAKHAAAALGAATAAVAAFGAGAVNTGMQFDSAMSQVAATMGTTVDKIQDLRDFAQEMGATTAFSATQAAEALNYMALAGYDAEKSMEMLPTVLDLAAAGGIDLASASDMVTDAASALGLDMEQTAAMVDQMAAASSKSNTSVQQLGEAFLTVGGTAKSLSGGTVELAAALGVLADNGVKGSEGGTALRNVLLGLQGDKFEKTFGALGVSAYDANGNLRPLEETLADMNAVMEGMTDQERTDIITNTFNRNDLKSVNALLATSTERWDELTASIDGSEGAAARMAATQLDNLQGDVTLLQSAFEGMQIAISDGLTPAFRKYVQFAGTALQDLTMAFKEGGLEGLTGKFSEVLQTGLEMVAESTPELLDAAVHLLGAIGEAIINAAPALLDMFYQLLDSLITTLRENMPSMLDAAGSFILTFLTSIVQNAPQILASLLSLLVEAVAYVIAHVPDMLAAGIELIGQLLVGIGQAVGEIGGTVGEVVQAGIDAVGQFVSGFFSAGADLIQGLIDGIGSAIGGVVDTIMGGLGGAIDSVKDFLGIASPSKLFKYFGQMTMEGLAEGIDSGIADAEKAMGRAVDAVSGSAEFGITANSGMVPMGANVTQVYIGNIDYSTNERIRTGVETILNELYWEAQGYVG